MYCRQWRDGAPLRRQRLCRRLRSRGRGRGCRRPRRLPGGRGRRRSRRGLLRVQGAGRGMDVGGAGRRDVDCDVAGCAGPRREAPHGRFAGGDAVRATRSDDAACHDADDLLAEEYDQQLTARTPRGRHACTRCMHAFPAARAGTRITAPCMYTSGTCPEQTVHLHSC